MFNKSLIQFSVDTQGCVPSLLLDLGPNYGGGNEDNGNLLQKVPCTALLHSGPPILQQATADTHLHRRLLDTHRQVWVSLLSGHCSFLLGPGIHKVLFVPSKSLFPQSCVSSGSSMAGLMATSSRRSYATPRSAAPSLPLWHTTANLYLCRRHSNTVLAQSLWVLWVLVHTRFV